MKKKKLGILIILIITFIIIFICYFKFRNRNNFDEMVNNNRDLVRTNIGVTNNEQVIVKFSTDDYDECYYVYKITDSGYTQYLYILHDSVDEFNNYIDTYKLQPTYSLRYEEEAYLTIITLNDTINSNNIDIKKHILSQFNDSKFEIIE